MNIKRSEWIVLVVGIAIVGAVLLAFRDPSTPDAISNIGNTNYSNTVANSTNNNQQPMNPDTTQPQTPAGKNISTDPRIQIIEVAEGSGAVAVNGKTVTVHYTGTFTNGQKFDSSVDRGQPFSFTLGAGQVIQGWDIGVAGMKVGGKRHLVIQSDLGYGPNTYGPIPGGSTLVFDVELLGVK